MMQPLPDAAEVRTAGARCCTLAMRASAADFQPIAPSVAAVAAGVFPLPGGHHFSGPLGLGLELFLGDAVAGFAFMAALASISALPAVAALRAWGAGDDHIELARVRPSASFNCDLMKSMVLNARVCNLEHLFDCGLCVLHCRFPPGEIASPA
jgi:hypothetical protein